MKTSVKIVILFLLNYLLLNLSLINAQWPSVDKMMKSHYLPSLEVKIHPPDEYQPKVQAAINKIEADREKAERKLMQTLEKDYNDELDKAAETINKIIKDSLDVFEDKNLLSKSAEYAINPPLITINKPYQNKFNKDPKLNNPNFKEIADFSMSAIQKDTMKALVDDDNKLEKFRNAKVNISLGEGITENEIKSSQESFLQKADKKQQTSNNHSNQEELISGGDGPIDLGDYSSFLELKQDGKFSKPISVVMKLPPEPDGKIKKEIEKIEKERVDHEKKLFTKAKEEFKLITQITVKELQLNLNHELIPFFVVSKNDLKDLKTIIKNNFPEPKKARFLQINPDEAEKSLRGSTSMLNENLSKEDLINLNKYTYSKILDLFSLKDNSNNENSNNEAYNIQDFSREKRLGIGEETKIKKSLNVFTQESTENQKRENEMVNNLLQKRNEMKENEANKTKKSDKQEIKENEVNFDFDSCSNMKKSFPDLTLDCDSLQNDYQEVTSFLETQSKTNIKTKSNLRKGEEDFINVKFSAAEESYPTIEKLVAQMMTRRDLAEKFERLKILEFETNLFKAENEMIQDILHENLYKIMAKYGPAIEGMKEHVK